MKWIWKIKRMKEESTLYLGRDKQIWYLSPMRAAKVQASLRIRAVSPEPSLLAHTSSESRGTFRQKARSLAPLNGWACAVKVCHDGMLEDTNSLVGAHFIHPNDKKPKRDKINGKNGKVFSKLLDLPIFFFFYSVLKHFKNATLASM